MRENNLCLHTYSEALSWTNQAIFSHWTFPHWVFEAELTNTERRSFLRSAEVKTRTITEVKRGTVGGDSQVTSADRYPVITSWSASRREGQSFSICTEFKGTVHQKLHLLTLVSNLYDDPIDFQCNDNNSSSTFFQTSFSECVFHKKKKKSNWFGITWQWVMMTKSAFLGELSH